MFCLTFSVTFFIQRRIVGLWQRIGFLYNRSAEKKKLEYALHVLQTWTWNAISYRRGLLDADTAVESTDDLHAKVRRPFLDSLLVSQRETGSYTDQNLREEVDSIIFGVRTSTLYISKVANYIFVIIVGFRDMTHWPYPLRRQYSCWPHIQRCSERCLRR